MLPVTAPSVAEIVDVPRGDARRGPLEPAALEMVAVAAVADAQVALVVRVCVVA